MKNKEIKVHWLENLRRLVRQKLGYSRCSENQQKAGRKKLGKFKKENPAY